MSGHHAQAEELIRAFRQLRHIQWVSTSSEDVCTKAELILLMTVHKSMECDSEGLKASEISSLLKISSPSVTQMLNVLEAKGLLARTVDTLDRRIVRVKLTENGIQLAKQAQEEMLIKANGFVEHIGTERAAQLIEMLHEVFGYYVKD